jgi:hypothetical protein
MTPIEPAGLVAIVESEVLHLPDGDLTTRVNAVYHSTSPDVEFSSMHTIVGGTGRYEGATGFLQLRGRGGLECDYVGRIYLRGR